MITKRQLGIGMALAGVLALAAVVAVDFVRAGNFQGFGPFQRLGLGAGIMLMILGLSLLPLGNKPA